MNSWPEKAVSGAFLIPHFPLASRTKSTRLWTCSSLEKHGTDATILLASGEHTGEGQLLVRLRCCVVWGRRFWPCFAESENHRAEEERTGWLLSDSHRPWHSPRRWTCTGWSCSRGWTGTCSVPPKQSPLVAGALLPTLLPTPLRKQFVVTNAPGFHLDPQMSQCYFY